MDIIYYFKERKQQQVNTNTKIKKYEEKKEQNIRSSSQALSFAQSSATDANDLFENKHQQPKIEL